MTLYSEALNAITETREQKQKELDEAATQARQHNVTATREALRSLVGPTDPMRPVAELLAHSLTIGRDDGFPARKVSDEAREAYVSAIRALGYVQLPGDLTDGLLGILATSTSRHGKPRLDLDRVARKEGQADVQAYLAAKDYREKQVLLD